MNETKQSVCEWLAEREQNSRRIASIKRGADRGGWLDDAENFRKAYDTINNAALLLRGMSMDPRIPADVRQIMLDRAQAIESEVAA